MTHEQFMKNHQERVGWAEEIVADVERRIKETPNPAHGENDRALDELEQLLESNE